MAGVGASVLQHDLAPNAVGDGDVSRADALQREHPGNGDDQQFKRSRLGHRRQGGRVSVVVELMDAHSVAWVGTLGHRNDTGDLAAIAHMAHQVQRHWRRRADGVLEVASPSTDVMLIASPARSRASSSRSGRTPATGMA